MKEFKDQGLVVVYTERGNESELVITQSIYESKVTMFNIKRPTLDIGPTEQIRATIEGPGHKGPGQVTITYEPTIECSDPKGVKKKAWLPTTVRWGTVVVVVVTTGWLVLQSTGRHK
jgi:hypothetical protein